MSERIEGTIILDGLLEGPLPSPKVEEALRQWITRQAGAGLRFSLATEGGTFNILAANKPAPASALGSDPADRIEEALRDLQELLPPESRKGLFSTLRSTEYGQGREIQTLYVVTPGGGIRRGQRTVEAQTAAPPHPVTRKQRLKLAAMGLGAALVFLAISALFVDYRGLLRDAWDRFTPLNPDALQVDAGPFAEYLAVEKKSASPGGREAVLTLRRTAAFPRTPDDCQELLDGNAGKALPSRLAVEALARGYVRCELLATNGDFLGASMERIAPLRDKETFDLVIPMPRGRSPARVVITY